MSKIDGGGGGGSIDFLKCSCKFYSSRLLELNRKCALKNKVETQTEIGLSNRKWALKQKVHTPTESR